MELCDDWIDFSALTIFEAAYLLAVKDDPKAHAYQYQCDQTYSDIFDSRQDIQELIADKQSALMTDAHVGSILDAKYKVFLADGDLNPLKTLITKASFIKWCDAQGYSEVANAFKAQAKNGKANLSPLNQGAHPPQKTWQEEARRIADELFENDTSCNCRDSLKGYSSRVRDAMREQKIHSSRGPITNPSTIQREALQAEKWWALKSK
jgi:hypothetical protein